MDPQITALSNGGFVVTWEDISAGVGGATGDTSSVAVKAQVFTADGTRVGTELLVNTATANEQSTPQITALANGGFVVTWQDVSQGVGGATGDSSSGREGAGVRGRRDARGRRAPGQHRDRELSAWSADHGAVERRLRGDVGRTSARRRRRGRGRQRHRREGAGVRARRDARGHRAPGQHRDGERPELQQITALSNGGFVVTWRDISQASAERPGTAATPP